MYLEQVSNKSKKEILKMPYPEFREYLSFYTNPDDFLKPEMKPEQQQNELDRIKLMKKQLEGIA